MNCTFTITNDSKQAISTIAPGSYQIDITTPQPFAEVDLSGSTDMTACKSFVQFQITGPGVNLFTNLGDGDSAFALLQATFQPGATYTAIDNNQPSVAKLVFATSATGTAASPAAPYTNSTSGKGTASTDIVGSALKGNGLLGSLDAIVYASGKLTLGHNGKAVTSLKSGNWTFSLDDESHKAGFVLQVLHGKPQMLTTAGYICSKDVNVTLKPGRWTFYRAGGAKTTFFVTS